MKNLRRQWCLLLLLLISFSFRPPEVPVIMGPPSVEDVMASWNGKVDAITFDASRNLYVIFNDDEVTIHRWNSTELKLLPELEGLFPTKITNWNGWPKEWGNGPIDAAAYDSERDVYYLFKGDQFVRHKFGKGPDSGYPKLIKGNWSGWPSTWGTGDVDAVTYDSKRDAYYLFKDFQFVRHDFAGPPNPNYPRSIADHWSGWFKNWNGKQLSAITYDSERDVYYLFNWVTKDYLKHEWGKSMPSGYPVPVVAHWKGYPTQTASSSFTMAFASDTQLGYCASNACKYGPGSSLTANEWHSSSIYALSEHVKARGMPFKGVVINGDMTNTVDDDYEVPDYERLYRDAFTVYPGMGNHEWDKSRITKGCSEDGYAAAKGLCAKLVYEDFAREVLKAPGLQSFDYLWSGNKATGSWAYSWDIGKFHFIQLNYHPAFSESIEVYNSKRVTTETFSISSAMDWLEKDVARNRGKIILINMHAINHLSSKDAFDPDFSEYDEFEDIINENSNIKAVFAGHYHEYVADKEIDKYSRSSAYSLYSDRTFEVGGSRHKVNIIYCGSAEFSKYLEVVFSPSQIEVWVIDSKNGKYVREERTHTIPL